MELATFYSNELKVVLQLHTINAEVLNKKIKEPAVTMSDSSILIISDEEAIRESLLYILSEEGYSCFASPDARQALKLLQTHPTDIVLIDCQLPRSFSFNIIGKIKKINPEMIIVIITSYTDADLAYRALQNGANYNLFKPIDFDELIKLLTTVFKDSPSRK